MLAPHSIPGQNVGGEIVLARNVGHTHLEAAECQQESGNSAARREFSFGQLLAGVNARYTIRQNLGLVGGRKSVLLPVLTSEMDGEGSNLAW